MVSLSVALSVCLILANAEARPTSGHSRGKASAGGGKAGHVSISTSVRVRAIPSCSRSSRPSAANTSARPGAAARVGLQPHLQRAFPRRQRKERGPEVDRRGTIGTPDRQRGCGEQPLDLIVQSGQTRQGNCHAVGGAHGPRHPQAGTRTAGRKDLQRLETQPRGSLGLESSEQFVGWGRFVQFKFHDFAASFNADRQGQREVHARLGAIPPAHAQRQPGAAK